MPNLAVLASGSGSNFQAIAEQVQKTRHHLCCLICDQKNAYVFTRARLLNVPSYFVEYSHKNRESSENKILSILHDLDIDIVCLAGFMRILTPSFLNNYPERIVNIHPSLLPKYPGTKGIQESFESGDREIGITIHCVDEGIDTGKIIIQKKCNRTSEDTLESVENKIHHLEHTYYPEVIIQILNETAAETADQKSWRKN